MAWHVDNRATTLVLRKEGACRRRGHRHTANTQELDKGNRRSCSAELCVAMPQVRRSKERGHTCTSRHLGGHSEACNTHEARRKKLSGLVRRNTN